MPIILWDAVTTNQDGTPITDLAGYKVYHGIVPAVYDAPVLIAVGTTTYNSTGINESINNYYTVSAYDTTGIESTSSNIIVWNNCSPQSQSPVRYVRQFA